MPLPSQCMREPVAVDCVAAVAVMEGLAVFELALCDP